MAGHPVRNLSVRCAVNQSGRPTCEGLRRGSPTAITSATPVTASFSSQRSKSMQGRHDNHRRFEVPTTNGSRPLAGGRLCGNTSEHVMDLPSRQSLQISSRSPSSVRLAAISTRSHRTVLRGRDETVAGAGGVTVSTIPASRRRAGTSSLARLLTGGGGADQPVVVAFRRPDLNRNVLTQNVARFSKALLEGE